MNDLRNGFGVKMSKDWISNLMYILPCCAGWQVQQNVSTSVFQVLPDSDEFLFPDTIIPKQKSETIRT